ncbi:MAG: hypothetical protein ACFE94_05100 [Candidatus Hodarchaeota archaeon]
MMIESLNKLFNDIELSWIDTYKDITDSMEFTQLVSIFPNLENSFQEGRDKDNDEYHRTIRHIFRLFKIYFLIKNREFSHETLSQESLNIIREKLLIQHSQNELVVPIILMYHDIGRLDNKKEHPYYSYSIISKKNLLERYNLSGIDKLLINKVIQYHLLFATIYTGESSFYGVYSLLNDTEFKKLLTDKKSIDRFIDLLEIFTYIDILGYSYAHIYDHYIQYYNEINNKLKTILNLWPDEEKALKKALEYSLDWLDWRIAGALRIFQYVNTKPYLTKNFYFKKIQESNSKDRDKIINVTGWNELKEQYLTNSSKIQLKYGLAILMLLAFGKFFRGPIKEEETISSNLILFWILLSEEITRRSSEEKEYLWNVHFIGLPNWWKWDRKFKKELNYHTLKDLFKDATHDVDTIKKEFNLYLDFTSVFN